MVKPLKALFPEFSKLEESVTALIGERFGEDCWVLRMRSDIAVDPVLMDQELLKLAAVSGRRLDLMLLRSTSAEKAASTEPRSMPSRTWCATSAPSSIRGVHALSPGVPRRSTAP